MNEKWDKWNRIVEEKEGEMIMYFYGKLVLGRRECLIYILL